MLPVFPATFSCAQLHCAGISGVPREIDNVDYVTFVLTGGLLLIFSGALVLFLLICALFFLLIFFLWILLIFSSFLPVLRLL